MKFRSTKNIFFDDETTKIMGAAYERACKSIPNFSGAERMRVIFAKRILEGARLGERDPHRLHLRAINYSTINVVRTRNVGVVRDITVPAYAQVPRTA
jgi:hypothetical protein